MSKTMINKMVDRFLGWKLPKDFAPDAGISFKPTKPDGYDEPGCWPTGTNLLTAEQAREMVKHMLADALPNDTYATEEEGAAYTHGFFEGAEYTASQGTNMTHLLFAGHKYYPDGGIADLVARGTIDELKKYFQENAKAIAGPGGYIHNWGQIVNAETLECVLWGELSDDKTEICEPAEAIWRDQPSN